MDVADMLGIDPRDPLAQRAQLVVDADHDLVRELKRRREELGLTQSAVAERMEITQSAVARIESGVRDLRQSTLRRYAMAVEAVIEHAVRPHGEATPRRAIVTQQQTASAGAGSVLHLPRVVHPGTAPMRTYGGSGMQTVDMHPTKPLVGMPG